MLQRARLKLTAWYLLILMLISILFSGAIYRIASSQIEGLIHRQNERLQHLQDEQEGLDLIPFDLDKISQTVITSKELSDRQRELLDTLVILNGFIFIAAGGASYFLAGRTLRPIESMIDEQNSFISNSSHELRTPIATIRTEMETSLLEKHISDKKARELTKSYLEEIESLQYLTNNLLKLAKIHDFNLLKDNKEEVSLLEVIETSCKKMQPLARRKNIEIKRRLSEAIVYGEKAKLAEIFTILLDNAIKYSPEKTKVEISIKNTGNGIKVVIKDQGYGIAKEDLPHIFDRFFRADKSHSEEGFGLGLSIAKKDIELLGGTIQVQSELGKGTKFVVILPRLAVS